MIEMNRYTVWALLLCAAAAPWNLSGAPASATTTAAKRPNIIFLLTDDQRDGSLGIMGHPWVGTPHLDRLVARGVRFRNAYIAAPICCPSRVSLFTGMHERVHGINFTSSYKLNEEQWAKTYPALLRAKGYHTGFIGKFGVEYYTFKGQAEKMFDFWRGHDGWAKFFPKTAENCSDYYDSEEETITAIMGESMTRFLDSAPTEKPFCLSVSFSVPHGSQTGSMHQWQAPANENPALEDHPIYGALYRNLKVEIPEETGGDPYRYIPKEVMDQDRGRNRVYRYNYDPKKCKEQHIRYYQQITGLDQVIGELLETLKRKGLGKNTVIIFASDHGLLMGEYGMGGKALLYDLASKFPCFVYDPRLPEDQSGKIIDSLVSSLDITSTILDYAGIQQPAEMQGRSLVPLMQSGNTPWRDSLFLESLYVGRDTPFSEGIRRGKWKYIRMYDGVHRYSEQDLDFEGRTPDFEQLFDLKKDPGEKHNLILEYEGRAILSDLRALCEEGSEKLNTQRAEYQKTVRITRRRGGAGNSPKRVK